MCPSLLSRAVINNSNLGMKRFIWLTCHGQSVTEGSQGRNSSRSRGRVYGRKLFTALLSMACPGCFLI